jgi:hypothetical protein
VLKWSAIKQALVDHFSDKRSLSVLEIEALTLRQGRNTLEHFHNEANELLTKTVVTTNRLVTILNLPTFVEDVFEYKIIKPSVTQKIGVISTSIE